MLRLLGLSHPSPFLSPVHGSGVATGSCKSKSRSRPLCACENACVRACMHKCVRERVRVSEKLRILA